MNAPNLPSPIAVSMSPRVDQVMPLFRRNLAMVSLDTVANSRVESMSWFAPTLRTMLRSDSVAACLPSIKAANNASQSRP